LTSFFDTCYISTRSCDFHVATNLERRKMENLNPILNALVQDLVKQLTPIVLEAVSKNVEEWKHQNVDLSATTTEEGSRLRDQVVAILNTFGQDSNERLATERFAEVLFKTIEADNKLSTFTNDYKMKELVNDVLDDGLKSRVLDILQYTDDENIIDVDAMAAKVIDNLDMGDLAEKVVEDLDMGDLTERVLEEMDLEDKVKDFFDNNSFNVTRA
jgi:hypothetical protein